MKQYTDLFVHVPAAGKPYSGTKPSEQPMTSLFEQSLLLVGDAIAMSLVRKQDIDLDSLWEFHRESRVVSLSQKYRESTEK